MTSASIQSASASEMIGTLTQAVQELSLARKMEDLQRVVRSAARKLAGADGAALVLREGDECVYVDEEAISPLWKGQRFPLTYCISGWAMLNRTPVAIEDIYADDRIPHAAYKPTFVKSLLMVPIRTMEPIGTIGIYWAQEHQATVEEIGAARALADSTAVAFEYIATLDRLARAAYLSQTDSLTKLPNRRAWDEALARAEAEYAGHRPFCVGLLDLDDFKAYNDAKGHRAGDAFLRLAGEAWRGSVRDQDFIARYGGDEFAVLLPDCLPETGVKVARRLLAAVPGRRKATVGLAPWTEGSDCGSLIDRADAALYRAKRQGGNRVLLAP